MCRGTPARRDARGGGRARPTWPRYRCASRRRGRRGRWLPAGRASLGRSPRGPIARQAARRVPGRRRQVGKGWPRQRRLVGAADAARGVDVLDAHQPLAAMGPRIEPAGQRGDQRTSVQGPGGRGREPPPVAPGCGGAHGPSARRVRAPGPRRKRPRRGGPGTSRRTRPGPPWRPTGASGPGASASWPSASAAPRRGPARRGCL